MGHAVGELNIETSHKSKDEIMKDLKDDETESDSGLVSHLTSG